MSQFPSESWDRKYAIGLVNLYTQESKFYRKLNYETRYNFPTTSTDIWRRSADLMNRGIDILGPTVHGQVYRGCDNLKPETIPVIGSYYNFKQITSTSLSRELALNFADCPTGGYLFDIKDVYALNIEEYSVYAGEKEVIVKSSYTFKVNKGINESIKSNGETYHVTVYYLDGQSHLYTSSNSGFIKPAGILMQLTVLAATILTFCR